MQTTSGPTAVLPLTPMEMPGIAHCTQMLPVCWKSVCQAVACITVYAGVFEQRVLEWEETGNIWLENDFGANSTETAKMGRDAGTVIAGLTQDAVWEEFSPTSMEARMLRHLRSLGGWTNVHATFTDFWAPLANHNRIANVSPGGSAGQAVVDFVIKELFLGFH